MATPAPPVYPRESRAQDGVDYHVRVRGTTYLWGSAGITANITFTAPLVLHVRLSKFGEPITIATAQADGTQAALGTLQPGEQLSLPIQGVSGIVATCQYETSVDCALRRS